MKTRDPDDLGEMENVLRDMKADEHTIKLLIDNWARTRGLYQGRRYNQRNRPYNAANYDRYDRQSRDWQPRGR